MKARFIFFLIFFSASLSLKAQEKLNFDQNSSVGHKIIIPAKVYTNGINKYSFNTQYLDKLIDFLKQNKTVYIEVNCFSDFTDVPLMNLMATKDQANEIRKYMVSKGVEGSRVNTVGSGDMFPIHSEEELLKMSNENRTIANLKNRRIEIKIIKKG